MTERAGEVAPADGSVVAAELRVLSGNPTDAELAAVTAVLTATIEDERDSAGRASDPQRSAWQRAQRPIRLPLSRGVGTWRSFSG